jgi:hypothetical protein
MNQYQIIPKVDAVREFLEIAGDFTNPLELVREAISNSLDAGATQITLDFTAQKEAGSHILQIRIVDNGRGMDGDERFTHEQLSDYIRWFTKFGSCELAFGHTLHSAKVIPGWQGHSDRT